MAAKRPRDPYKARCIVCAEDISFGLYGITALFPHADSTKHEERLPKDTPTSLLKRTEPSSSASTLLSNGAGDSSEALSLKKTAISVCTNKQLVTKAEIIWTLDVAMSKYSFNSSLNKSYLFTTMFSDIGIVNNFSCGKTKCRYFGPKRKFGILPYFVELLNSLLKDVDHFVTLFDESFNCNVKTNQVDLHIQFCDSNKDIATARYYGSEFLGKSPANDIWSHFKQFLGPLEKRNYFTFLQMYQT